MKQIKTLADQIRERTNPHMQKTAAVKKKQNPVKTPEAKKVPDLIVLIQEFEYASGKNTIHVRLDEKTAALLTRLKMATGIDQVKLVAFAVKDLFDRNPELKTHIKNYLENLEL